MPAPNSTCGSRGAKLRGLQLEVRRHVGHPWSKASEYPLTTFYNKIAHRLSPLGHFAELRCQGRVLNGEGSNLAHRRIPVCSYPSSASRPGSFRKRSDQFGLVEPITRSTSLGQLNLAEDRRCNVLDARSSNEVFHGFGEAVHFNWPKYPQKI